ncbi:MAG: hypothetical protein ABS95_01875 [Verrucomicrobia bacterium SCN 57-15]|nr:MAG: hypothetical protein ABS95_01875 [Verrucomicrobia bacterium SCN 57-15]
MKALLNCVERSVMILGAMLVAGLTLANAQAQTDLPYSSGSTGADGPLAFRTIPVGGRYFHALAYDSTRKQMVLFGGFNQNLIAGGVLGDTWVSDGTNWTKLNPANSPTRRQGAAMVYVPWNGGRVILFGGQDANNVKLADTWSWDGVTWTQLQPPSSPVPRAYFPMVYDSERNKIMIFSGNGVGNDTWLFDGTTWTNPNVPNPPPTWDQHIAAFDAERKNVVLLGYDGTYIYDGTTWSKVNPQDSPPRSGRGGMVYDPVHKNVVLFAGEGRNGTYIWNGSNWIAQTPTNVPPGFYNTEMVFDSNLNKVVLFGGQSVSGDGLSADMWQWNGSDWKFISGRTQWFDMTGRANGIWNYTTINVPSGVTVLFTKNSGNTPARWLASGNVQIDGALQLDGGFGDNSLPEGKGGAGGPGGFDGGHGGIRLNRSGSYVGSPGQGPGGGLPGTQPVNDGNIRDGKSALYATIPGGYGNIYIQPLIGGSGGGGGASNDTIDGGNGGGGGGAILIASSRDIVINGAIYSRGGDRQWSGASQGGRGSGGSILLRADRVTGSGSVDATPDGRIRFEAYYRTLAGSTQPTSVNSAPVSSTDFNTVGTLNIVSVKGVNVVQPPTGNTLTPDVIFTDAGAVNVVVQGTNIPNGTPVNLRIATSTGVVTPPAQNINNGSVTFNVTVPKGIGTLQAFASFTINN